MQTRGMICFGLLIWSAMGAAASAQVPPAPYLPSSVQSPLQADGEVLSLSLEEAIALAIRDNRNIRAMRLRRVIERFDIFLVQRSYWPQGGVSLQAASRRNSTGEETQDWSASPYLSWHSPVGTRMSASWSSLGDETRGYDGWRQSDSLSVSVRQPLLKGAGLDANLAALRQSRRTGRLQALNEEAVLSDTVAQVIGTYRDLMQAQSMVELSRQSLERMEGMLANHEALVEAGRMAPADIIQTQANLATMRLSQIDNERRVITAQRNLLQLLALDPRQNVQVLRDVSVEQVHIDADEAVATAFDLRRDYQGHRLEIERLEEERHIARRNRLWDLSLVAGYNRYDDYGGFAPREDRRIGIQLDIPIADFSGRRAVMSADTAAHIGALGQDELRERIEGQVRDAVANVDSMWRQVLAADTSLGLAKNALEIQQERLQAGRTTTFEVLSMEAAVRTAEAQVLSARIAYLNALTALDQQTGRTLQTWQISLQN